MPIQDITYRNYIIQKTGSPFGLWGFFHEDYDGAPDAEDFRCGNASSIVEVKEQIDEQIEELGGN